MMPPVGVQASVLSHDTIKVSWADNTLHKSQKITDNRFYTVRWKTNIPANTKVKVTAPVCGSPPLSFNSGVPKRILLLLWRRLTFVLPIPRSARVY